MPTESANLLGFGSRHPALLEILARVTPAVTAPDTWGGGTVPLEVSSHVGAAELPDELITSVRCIVRIGGRVVVCRNADGRCHPWPGGRREPGESLAETAAREVAEETCWRIRTETLQQLGWLHLRHLQPRPPDLAHLDHLPWPDFLQVVFTAVAGETHPAGEWTDNEGYEQSSALVDLGDVPPMLGGDPWAQPFLDLLAWREPERAGR